METSAVLEAYLRALLCAKVILSEGDDETICFNGYYAPGDFNAFLIECELKTTLEVHDFLQANSNDKQRTDLVKKRIQQLQSLFIYDEQKGWSHRNLAVFKGTKLVNPFSQPVRLYKKIQEYICLQKASLDQQCRLFFSFYSGENDNYTLTLTPTELIEMALAFDASGRIENSFHTSSCVGVTRFLADALGLSFPANYNSLKQQIQNREKLTVFLDELKRSLTTHFMGKRK